MQSLETLLAPGQPTITSPAEVEEELRAHLRVSSSWVSVLTHMGYSHRETANNRVDMLCPFHGDKTPSLRMWPSGFFYCHGCQARGDVLDFVLRLSTDRQPLRIFLPPPDPNQGKLLLVDANGSVA